MSDLPNVYDPKLVVGFDTADDACVYRLTDEIAAIHTVDFFTPIVDDPYWFGQIAASNALSDVYAMGGKPAVAMNILCVPNCLSKETIRQILMGGHDKAVEAGCVIAGGHTIQDNEPKYGMCVTGYVHPDRILRNVGSQPGDKLIITKPIGTGVVSTGAKADLVDQEQYMVAVKCMAELNNKAAEQMLKYAEFVHACTDITGFGLLGHTHEMSGDGAVTVRLDHKKVPILPGSRELAEMGIIPAGAYRNLEYVKEHFRVGEAVPQYMADLVADPQSSGGLLIALPGDKAEALLADLLPVCPFSAMVGEIVPYTGYTVELV